MKKDGTSHTFSQFTNAYIDKDIYKLICNLIINESSLPNFSYKIAGEENSGTERVVNKYIEYMKTNNKYPSGLKAIEVFFCKEFYKITIAMSIIFIVSAIVMLILYLLFFGFLINAD